MISSVSTSALIEESPKFHNPQLVSIPKQAGRPGSGTSQKGFLATWLIYIIILHSYSFPRSSNREHLNIIYYYVKISFHVKKVCHACEKLQSNIICSISGEVEGWGIFLFIGKYVCMLYEI